MKARLGLVGCVVLISVLGLTACGSDDSANTDSGNASTGAGSASTGAASSTAAPEVVKLGVNIEATGPVSSLGEAWKNGIQLATDTIAENGGFEVNGQRYIFETEVLDNQSTPDRAISNAQELAGDGVTIMLGPGSSGAFAPTYESIKGEDILVGTTAGISSTYVAEGDLPLLKLVPKQDGDQGSVAREVRAMLANVPGIETVAIIGAQSDIGVRLVDYYTAAFEAEGLQVVYSDKAAPDTRDFSSYLTAARNASPDMVAMLFNDSFAQPILNQAVQLGFTEPLFLGGQGSTEAALQGFDASNIRYIYAPLSGVDMATSTDPRIVEFNEAYTEAFGTPPTGDSPTYYDTVFMIAEAMKEAGTVDDVRAITAVLKSGAAFDYPGKALDITYSPLGEKILKGSVILVDSQGRHVFPTS